MEIRYLQGVVLMKEKINFDNCMKRKCNECKYYDYCFEYKKEKKENVSKSNRKIQETKYKR